MRLILYQGCSLNWPNTWWGFLSDKTTKWHEADTNCHHPDQSIAEKKGKNTILNIFGNCTFFFESRIQFLFEGISQRASRFQKENLHRTIFPWQGDNFWGTVFHKVRTHISVFSGRWRGISFCGKAFNEVFKKTIFRGDSFP